jgi:hypothetical protein
MSPSPLKERGKERKRDEVPLRHPARYLGASLLLNSRDYNY